MGRTTFEVVQIKGQRRWRENGKARQETRTFMQTINPWNVGADGLSKSREAIVAELLAERLKWLNDNPGTFSQFSNAKGESK